MSEKAIIYRTDPATGEPTRLGITEARDLGFTIEHELEQGMLVSGDPAELEALEAQGLSVKLLPETNVLTIGDHRIDIERPPKVPRGLRATDEAAAQWPHHLVQLAGPRTTEWIEAIEDSGVEVVEPISSYGLFVVGSPEDVEALNELPFVAWTGPFEPAYRIHPNLKGRKGVVSHVGISVYPPEESDVVRDAVERVGGEVVREATPPTGYHGEQARLVVDVDAARLPELAGLPPVRWLEFVSPEPGLDGERETQIMAENLDAAAAPNTAPVTGYQGWLGGLGLNGAGVTIAICDTGVDQNANNNATGHADIRGRQVAFVDYTGGTAAGDGNGHGTHVAGIALGNASTGLVEAAAPNNFLWGQGMAPQAGLVAQNALLMAPWPPANFGLLTQDAVTNGAQVINNSWTDLSGAGAGYTANARVFDQLVRDPNQGTAALDYLVIVFSAGNSGSNPRTITGPKEAKNPIIVGNSLTFRPGFGAPVDDIRGVAASSSRGPAIDGRLLPTVVAPGTNVSSALSSQCAVPPGANTVCAVPAIAGTGNAYVFASGTSMASPHVAGACALLIQWWRVRTGGRDPSPALLKALLINGAEDLAPGPDGAGGNLANIPNNDQGWGRVSLENVLLQTPVSDRGPKIFTDQRHAFTANGQEHMIRVAAADPTRPLRITLVWTDAPAGAGSNPALVNDLDLQVTETATGNVFRGNVFANGFSTTGGAFDNRNNIECVYRQNPNGVYEVRVRAASVATNARPPFNNTPWQDFALVIDNGEVPAAAPVRVVPVIDRSGSMVAYGYVDVTRTSSKQFVDLMSVDDRLGIASFATTADVEFPTGPSPTPQPITGQLVRNSAKVEIDGIAFGGATFMGGGISQAASLLAAAPAGSRAIVLLSDGYDNKGFVPANPSAMDAVAALPASMPVYTCAMGPSSDQALLGQIATATGGRYYYMPTIDDLFEVYNYIRGQVTGTGVIANESRTASRSRVRAFVDAAASDVTFTVAWADPNLRFVAREPRKKNEITVRLIAPNGMALHPQASFVRRIDGTGYVVFKVDDPRSGAWFVEVVTPGETHTRYTAAAFVTSPIRLDIRRISNEIVAGQPLRIVARVLDGKQVVQQARGAAVVVGPALSVANLQRKHRAKLRTTKPLKVTGDRLPPDIGKLLTLDRRLRRESKPPLFSVATAKVPLPNQTAQRLAASGLSGLAPSSTAALTRPTGVLAALFASTVQQGSYNVVVTASGVSPGSNTRFERKALASVLAL